MTPEVTDVTQVYEDCPGTQQPAQELGTAVENLAETFVDQETTGRADTNAGNAGAGKDWGKGQNEDEDSKAKDENRFLERVELGKRDFNQDELLLAKYVH